NTIVRARRMSMRPDDQARAPITEMAGRVLFSSCLTMEINDDRIDIAREPVSIELGTNPAEWIFRRLHEETPKGIDDQRTLARFGIDPDGPPPGCARKVVDGAHQARAALDERERLPSIPRVIAQRDGIRARSDNFLVIGSRDSKALVRG